MADSVRQILESMIPELDALHERGLFTKQELKDVVRRRTEFEYAIKRPSGKVSVAEYFRYIEYETKFEELRKLRVKTPKAIEAVKNDKIRRRTKGKAEFCIIRRLHFIFSRAIKKFSGNISLWKTYFEFCKKYGGSKSFSKMLTKALQLHPNKAGMWIEAASWELNGHHNETAARSLLQQGLRICKTSNLLWQEYFKFELLMARRMQLKKEVIQLSNTTDTQYNPGIASGTIAKIVLKKALEALGQELEVYSNFLTLLDSFDSGAFLGLEKEICHQMKDTLASDPNLWYFLAQRELNQADPSLSQEDLLRNACAIFDEGVQRAQSSSHHELYLRFLEERVITALQTKSKKILKFLLTKVLKTAKDAEAAGYATPNLYLMCINTFQRCQNEEQAKLLARKAVQMYPLDADINFAFINLIEDHSDALCTAKERAAGFDYKNFLHLVVLISKWTSHKREAIWIFEQLSERIKACDLMSDALPMYEVAAELLVLWRTDIGMESIRNIYAEFLTVPAIPLSFYRACIQVEKDEAGVNIGQVAYNKKLIALIERALARYGHVDSYLWLDLMKAHENNGKLQSEIYWRAIKNLDEKDSFEQAYQEYMRSG